MCFFCHKHASTQLYIVYDLYTGTGTIANFVAKKVIKELFLSKEATIVWLKKIFN